MSELYRKNVGIVLCKNGKVLLCARADQKNLQWQFPQGGVEAGESIIDAAKRELYEETGIKQAAFINQMPISLRYDFPKETSVFRFGSYKGQEQTWVLFKFNGNDDDINFYVHPEEVEFKAFKWADISEAPKRIIAFKKQVYKQVAEYFAPYVEKNK